MLKVDVERSIGKGKLIFLWWDIQHPHGASIKEYGHEILNGTGLPSNAKVSDLASLRSDAAVISIQGSIYGNIYLEGWN